MFHTEYSRPGPSTAPATTHGFRLRGLHGTFEFLPAPQCVSLHSHSAAREFLRGFVEPEARVEMRRLLAHCHDTARLSDDQILDALASMLVAGRFVARRDEERRVFKSVRREAKPEPPLPPPKTQRPEVEEEAFVLAAEVKTIGGTLLMNHPVRVLDPDTGAIVIDSIETDDDGVVRSLVPKNKTYRIEILDETWEGPEQAFESDDRRGMLVCRFVDATGAPVADLAVEARQDDQVSSLTTDAEGWIESAANLAPYELHVGEQVFHAHAVLAEDVTRDEDAPRDDETVRYEFVVDSVSSDEEADESEEDEHRLERDDSPFAAAAESLGIDLAEIGDLAELAGRLFGVAPSGLPDRPDVPRADIPRPGIPEPEIPRPGVPRPAVPGPEIPRPELSRPTALGGKELPR